MKRLEEFRGQFPLLAQQVYGKALVYFDNGATTQKPNSVIDAINHFYQNENANVHRASHAISTLSTVAFEHSRQCAVNFINAKSIKEIIWTSGTTQSINLIAQSWGHSNLKSGDKIVVSVAEHHANIVPWQIVAQETGATIIPINVTIEGVIDLEHLSKELSDEVKLIAIPHISNVTGKLNPVAKVIEQAKLVGAKVLIDGAQAIAHTKVDVQSMGCDFYVFSAHKMFGPTGLGVLYGKRELLENMPPYQTGGEMIKRVSFSQKTTFNELPFKFEAGTPNISAVVAFSQSMNFIEKYKEFIKEQDAALNHYAYQRLSQIPEVKMLFKGTPDIPLISFTVSDQHNQDVAAFLDTQGIAIRAGHHCAMPLMEYLGINGCLRVSLAPYNTNEEVDRLIIALEALINGHSVNVEESTLETNSTEAMVATFNQASSWDKKHRELMMLGKSFSRMDKSLRSDASLISGCESNAWLVADTHNDKLNFIADSDAKIVRGLLSVTITAYQGKTAQQILAFDINGYFKELGLTRHLSPSRGNGLLAIVEKIKQIALSH